jgi:hypothetical protein
MRTLSCLYRRQRQPQRLSPEDNGGFSIPRVPFLGKDHAGEKGQVLVIFGLSLLALLAFVGLVVDAASIYVTYGQLKRAVDAASVAGANEFKRGSNVTRMTQSAREVMALHAVDMANVDLHLFICDSDGDGIRDPGLQTTIPEFYAKCPDTVNGEAPRKLVWVDAKQYARVYFLSLFGVSGIYLKTNAVSEAALINLVIVLDVSESMGSEMDADGNYRSPSYSPVDYNPNSVGSCNQTNQCYPLRDAKDAAIGLIETLYNGYDAVGLVTYAQEATAKTTGLTKNLTGVEDLLNANYDPANPSATDGVYLNDDPAYSKMWGPWTAEGRSNPTNPEDRDGDGQDYDNPGALGYNCPAMTAPTMADRWWATVEGATASSAQAIANLAAWGGLPCDSDTLLDAYDWNQNGTYDASDDSTSRSLLMGKGWNGQAATLPNFAHFLSSNSTCTGCGMRTAANLLKEYGSQSAVWVIVFLTDGVANQTDIPINNPGVVPLNGYCHGNLGVAKYWKWLCVDYQPASNPSNARYCVDSSSDSCPPLSVWEPSTADYSPEMYAMDMTDDAALTKSSNIDEPAGNDIAIYSIGLGAVGRSAWAGQGESYGEGLLRYMAAVGDDGDRTTDSCDGVSERTPCGQYYYAPTGEYLAKIFDDIATRIYTRITE